MTLTERIAANDPRHLPDNIVPLERVERRAKPAWMRRMEEQGLPNKDYTLGAFVPSGSDVASS